MLPFTLASPLCVLLSSLFLPTILAANIQAGSQPGLNQPSSAPVAQSQAGPNQPFSESVAAPSTQTSASQATPSSVPANGDPCGPIHQETPNFPDTCNAVPSLVQSPSAYGINCTVTEDIEKYPALRLSWQNVEASIYSICLKMEDTRTMTGKWIWSMLAPDAGVGFFIPPYPGSASRPSYQRCLLIFAAMNNTCATTTIPSNYASVNLKTPPGIDPSYFLGAQGSGKGYAANDLNYQGTAVNVGYPSYIIVQELPDF